MLTYFTGAKVRFLEGVLILFCLSWSTIREIGRASYIDNSIISIVVLFQATFHGTCVVMLSLMGAERLHEDELSSFLFNNKRFG